MSMVICGEQKFITRVSVRRVFVATSGDLKIHHKGWFVAKKLAFVMKIFATKTLCPCGARPLTSLPARIGSSVGHDTL